MVLYMLALIIPSATTSSSSSSSSSSSQLSEDNPTCYPEDLDIDPDLTISQVFTNLCDDTFAHFFSISDTSRGLQYVEFYGKDAITNQLRNVRISSCAVKKWVDICNYFTVVRDVTFTMYPRNIVSNSSALNRDFNSSSFSSLSSSSYPNNSIETNSPSKRVRRATGVPMKISGQRSENSAGEDECGQDEQDVEIGVKKKRSTANHAPRKKCPHGRQRAQCRECGGGSICPHNRIKSRCKDCGGSSICEHKREKSRCKLCGGSAICQHGKDKRNCVDCGGKAFCIHKIKKAFCKECDGRSLCEHEKCKYSCKECRRSSASAPN